VKPDPRIVIAGSRRLPPGQGPRMVFNFLEALPPLSLVLLRRGLATDPGRFELDVSGLCDILGVAYEWRAPYITRYSRGRNAVWTRDMEMLYEADLALCFYDVGQIGDEESGTVALVDKAMELNVPVYAYALDEDGKVIRVGEYDEENLWSEMVPNAA
jgi:hypothetical protein